MSKTIRTRVRERLRGLRQLHNVPPRGDDSAPPEYDYGRIR